MNITFDKRARKFLKSLPEEDKGRISGHIDLFSVNGFNMTGKYLKKIENNLWELRPGSIRVFFGLINSDAIIVNIFRKKTQKTPKQEIETAKRRLKEY
ncbi:type II toxin-antitoxin system RelE/ParE family toxin [Candidatus Daviesbacteria bacterium]|nr:type II toxin-antitoxin system RelE/ParE family toxin [Candidatus Daviesbacteria bacterium]